MCSFASFCSMTLLPELAINFVKFNVSWECIFGDEEDIWDVRMYGYLSVVLIILDAEGSDSHTCRLGEWWSLHQCRMKWWWHRSYPSSYYSGIVSHPSLLPHDPQVLGWLTASPDVCPQCWCGLLICSRQPLRTSLSGMTLNVQCTCRWVHAQNM